MGNQDKHQRGRSQSEHRPERTQVNTLQTASNCVTISTERRIKIFSQLVRHFTAIIYLVAELVIGTKPGKL
jgi:hypothetical protein